MRKVIAPLLAIIQRKHFIISGFYIFLLQAFNSCKTEECKDIQEWKIAKYRFVMSDCIGYAGPRYYPVYVYIDDKKQGGASQVDSCTFTWQASNENFMTFNVCDSTIKELKPNKIPLAINLIDSATMFSNEFKQVKRLTTAQTEKFVVDWNNSKTRGYSSNAPFDSAFYTFPAYQYRLTVFSKGAKRPFYCYNYVILDSSNWEYEMSKTSDLGYFRKYWEK